MDLLSLMKILLLSLLKEEIRLHTLVRNCWLTVTLCLWISLSGAGDDRRACKLKKMLGDRDKDKLLKADGDGRLINTFIGASWMGVMHEGSTMGLGRFAVSASKLCHCRGSPVNFCSLWSNPVCTLCSKLEGPEISSFFFFFPNMVEEPGEKNDHFEKQYMLCNDTGNA